MKTEILKFIGKITIVHVVTYTFCGLICATLFQYNTTLSQAGMRDMDNIIVGLAPLFQIIRGALFGMIFWFFRSAFLDKKYGWLMIWSMIVVIGIINTPGTAPSSIEYFIYYEPSQEPWNLAVGGFIEICLQTLLFSVLSFWWIRRKKKKQTSLDDNAKIS